MEKLLTNYSPTDIIMYTVILCLAGKWMEKPVSKRNRQDRRFACK